METSLLIKNNNCITDPQKLANTLDDAFENNSSDKFYNDANFRIFRKNHEETNIEITDDNTHPINYPISLEEIQSAINELKPGSSPGPDVISYDMLKQLPEQTINQIHKIYDYIWTNNVFPTK